MKISFSSPPFFTSLLCSLIIAVCGCSRENHPKDAKQGAKGTPSVSKQTGEPIDFEERFVAAREHASRGDYDQAYDILWDISDKSQTELILLRADIELCRTLEKLNRKDEAFYKRNACIARLKELIDTPTPDLACVMLLAESYTGAQDLEAADKIIENAKLQFTDESSQHQIAKVASKIQLQRAEEIADILDKDDFRKKLNFVGKALVFDDQNKDAHFQLIRYFIFAKLNEDQLMWLGDATLDGSVPAVARIAIGVRDSLRDKNDAAIKNFRIVRESFPQTGQLVNELIDYMIKSKSLPDGKLLNLVNAAIETCPDVLYLVRTRATLEMQLGNYQGASEDFQAFIDGVPDEFCIWSRQLLIEAQKKLGNVDAAKAQEKEFARIVAGFSPPEKAKVQRILEDFNKKINEQKQN